MITLRCESFDGLKICETTYSSSSMKTLRSTAVAFGMNVALWRLNSTNFSTIIFSCRNWTRSRKVTVPMHQVSKIRVSWMEFFSTEKKVEKHWFVRNLRFCQRDTEHYSRLPPARHWGAGRRVCRVSCTT